MTYKRVVVTEKGPPNVMQVVEEEIPEPGPGQVGVRVLAAGVSAYDAMLRRAAGAPGFPRAPFTPGVDIVGVAENLGEGVTTVSPDDTVAGFTGSTPDTMQNGYAEYVVVPEELLVLVPNGIDPARAVCLVANYLTAHVALHETARIKPGESVLIHGAAGGVGSALLDLGRRLGLEMYGTATKDRHDFVSRYGATPIDYREEDFLAHVREETRDGVDAVLDPIGGARQLRRSYQALRPGGRLAWFGVAATSRQGMKVVFGSVFMRMLLGMLPGRRKAPVSGNILKDIQNYRDVLAEFLESLARGELNPAVDEPIPLIEAVRAHEALERGGLRGKIVLVTG